MKLIKVIFIVIILFIIFLISCQNESENNVPVPIYLSEGYPSSNFGSIKVNETSAYYEFIIDAKENPGESGPANNYYPSYDSVKINITISDNVNFLIDTVNTETKLSPGEFTDFKIRFNPKSVGTFKAVINVDVIGSDGDRSKEITGIGIE